MPRALYMYKVGNEFSYHRAAINWQAITCEKCARRWSGKDMINENCTHSCRATRLDTTIQSLLLGCSCKSASTTSPTWGYFAVRRCHQVSKLFLASSVSGT